MMDLGKRGTVEPRNFLRVLRQIPEASALGLLDVTEPTAELMLAPKIQDFLRFLLEHLNKEVKEYRDLKPDLKDPRDNRIEAKLTLDA